MQTDETGSVKRMPRFDHASCTLPQTWPPADQSVLVLAMRRPRGWWLKAVRDAGGLWLKEAGPSDGLLDAYRQQVITWEEFAERYRAEMLNERPMCCWNWCVSPWHTRANT